MKRSTDQFSDLPNTAGHFRPIRHVHDDPLLPPPAPPETFRQLAKCPCVHLPFTSRHIVLNIQLIEDVDERLNLRFGRKQMIIIAVRCAEPSRCRVLG